MTSKEIEQAMKYSKSICSQYKTELPTYEVILASLEMTMAMVLINADISMENINGVLDTFKERVISQMNLLNKASIL